MMTRVSLKDVCDFLPKSRIRAGEGRAQGRYPFFTSSDNQSLFVDEYLYDGELLIIGTGGKPSCNYINGKFSVSTDNFIVSTKPHLSTKYLFYFLRYNNLSILEKGFRGAGLKHIGKEYLASIVIPVLSIAEQKAIVTALDKINELIETNRNNLNLLETLIKARFFELQKNIIITKEIGKHIDVITKGPFGSDMKKSLYVPKTPESYKVYIQVNVIEDNHELGDYYISKSYFEKKCRRYEVFPGDVLITCDGTLGKIMILNECIEKGVISSSLLKIRLKDSIRPVYFRHLWTMEILDEALKQVSNSALKHLPSTSKIQKIKVRILPLEKQCEFETFVRLVEKIKHDTQHQIDILKELQNKKMDEYFGGNTNA